MPAVLLATAGALALSERLCSAANVGPRLRAATTSTLVGVAAAAVFAAWRPVHAWLFGGYVHYSGAELSPASYLLRDGMLALAVALPAAIVLVQMEKRRGRAPQQKRSAFARGLAAAGATVGLSLVGLATVALSGSAARRRPGGLPRRRPAAALRRPGDRRPHHAQPLRRQRPDRARCTCSRTASPPCAPRRHRARSRRACATTPIQPLVIRANEGDCVEIAYTNNATGGAFGIHIDGLAYDIASSGDPVGLQPLVGTRPGRQHDVPLLRPERPRRSRARTTCTPARATALAVAHGLFGVARRRAGGLDLPGRRTASRSPPAGRP